MVSRTLLISALTVTGLLSTAATHAPANLDLSGLEKLGSVDERYQAYNVEMVEVTGGRFWAPYGGPAGEVYRELPPLDLANPRLVAMAKLLAPSLVRVSGTWANNIYIPAEGETVTTAPDGFTQLMSRKQWASVVAFSKAVDAPIVTSFAVSPGARDKAGTWLPEQAQRRMDLTKVLGAKIYAAEFFNEPNVPSAATGMSKTYGAADYAKDFRIFHEWARKADPDMKILGPGGVGEGSLTKNIPVNVGLGAHISSTDLIKDNPNSVDAFSYHFYGSVSQRCAHMGIGTAQKDQALSADWLDRTLQDYDFYSGLRDKYEAGKPIWNTETAQAACGGSPWASTFLDTFRYLNQNGVLAQRGVQVVMHNTLAASDYALIDRDTLTPRPNYWAAVLWKRTMGSVVLAAPRHASPEVRIFAHCLPSKNGGVGLVALNLSKMAQSLPVQKRSKAWIMTGHPIDTKTIAINGKAVSFGDDGRATGLDGKTMTGPVSVPAQSIAFVAVAAANNPACRQN
jgi:hypothetical protein